MKLLVFSVFDKAVQAYLQPFYARSKGEALRSFSEAANDDKHNFHRHAFDYTLVFLGEFDDHSAQFECGEPARLIGATECLRDDPFKEETRSEVEKVRRLPM